MELFGKTTILQYTSFVFFTNFIHNTWKREFPYAWLFLLLTVTSLFVHSKIFIETNPIPLIFDYSIYDIILFLDKIVLYSIIIYGGYLFWKTREGLQSATSSIPIVTFLTVVYLYVVGYFLNKYYFDPDINMANLSHGAVHIISSIGHHYIIYDYAKLQNMRNILLKGFLS